MKLLKYSLQTKVIEVSKATYTLCIINWNSMHKFYTKHIKTFVWGFICIFLLSSLTLNAQNSDLSKEIRKNMKKSEKENIDKSKKIRYEGYKYKKQADVYYKEKKKYLADANKASSKKKSKKLTKNAAKSEKKAVKKMIKAYEKYDKANKSVYLVYKKVIQRSSKFADEKVEDNINEKNDIVKSNFKKAKSLVKKSINTSNVFKAFEILEKAIKLQEDAIKIQEEVIAKLLDLEVRKEEKVVDNTKVNNNANTENTNTENTNTENTNTENTNTENTNTENTNTENTNTENTNTENTNTENTNTENTNTENTNTDNRYIEIKKVKNHQTIVIFKVQIAASRVPLSIEKLHSIYNGGEILNNELEDGWYKYSIGRAFSTYRKAYDYRNSIGVKGAFVVAYKDGVKVKDITEVAEPIDPPSKKTKSIKYKTKTSATVYRLQILSSRKKASAQKLNNINTSSKYVLMCRSKGFFKYTLGDFGTAQEALKFRKKHSLINTTVVMYKNGKPLN